MSETTCRFCKETRDTDYNWLEYHEDDCERDTLRAEVAALTAEILALKAILEEVQYMSVGCDCTDCYSLRMRLAERAANLLGLRDLPARSEGA